MAVSGGERKQDSGSAARNTESIESIREKLIKSRQACVYVFVCVCTLCACIILVCGYMYMCVFLLCCSISFVVGC